MTTTKKNTNSKKSPTTAKKGKKCEPVRVPCNVKKKGEGKKPEKKFLLLLTKQQLEHLRDLMAVSLDQSEDDDARISVQIATHQHRVNAELQLWEQLCTVFTRAKVEVDGENTPDYCVGIQAAPFIVQLNGKEEDSSHCGTFCVEEVEDEVEEEE